MCEKFVNVNKIHTMANILKGLSRVILIAKLISKQRTARESKGHVIVIKG